MTKPIRVLLSSDDGYTSPGIRVLAAVLKDHFDVKIAATTTQQSGVGGKISLGEGFNWKSDQVDGVPALAVDGTPVDAIEMALEYFEHSFDVILSGINWGANLTEGNISSGTFSAAWRGLSNGLARKAIAMSWDVPASLYLRTHAVDLDISDYIEYPGKAAKQVLEQALKHDFWGARMINCNFPSEVTQKAVFTKTAPYITDAFEYLDEVTRDSRSSDPTKTHGTFKYKGTRKKNITDPSLAGTDLVTVNAGHISLTLSQATTYDEKLWNQAKHTAIDLENS